MISIELAKTAQMMIEKAVAIKESESVCIVADPNTINIAEVLAAQVHTLGAEAVLVIMTTRQMHGNELPQAVAAAMSASDVIIAPTTYSITHTKARIEANKRGARILILRGITQDTMLRGAITADYEEIHSISSILAERLTKACRVRMTSSRGTDITMDVTGRKGLCLGGRALNPGTFTSLPTGEAAVAPIEGTANGTVIIDYGMDGIGVFQEPIGFQVEHGRIISIEGGKEADLLRDLLNQSDSEALNFAEFAIGTNPKSRMLGNMAEDKVLKGCSHIALGDNSSIGGTVSSSLHLDCVILKPNVWLDDEVVVKEGVLIF